jgi:ATP-dependent RNA helicase DHX57
MVILKAKNPKTQELALLPPFKLPPNHRHLALKPTALEARHFAATYALFRVCSMRNIHMMLPPDYKDLWKGEFESLKKEDVKDGQAWMYEADPFATLREREDAKAAMEKKRLEREKAKEKALQTPGGPGVGLALHGPNPSSVGIGTSNIYKGWIRVPKIEMGKRTRATVEGLIRRHATWNPHNVKMSDFQRHSIINEFKKLDFRESHVEEAVEECKDREESLEWLLIHVPEDDLPRWALPEGYVAGISMASSNLKREGAIKRLAEAGYSMDLCKQILDIHQDDEGKAAEALQVILMSSGKSAGTAPAEVDSSLDEGKNLDTLWDEELSSLESVFGDKYSRLSHDVCKVQINPANRGNDQPLQASIQIRRSSNYPYSVPIISIIAQLPAYIRLSIIKMALTHATENLLGEQMIFFLVDWVEQSFYRVVERPGKLREVSAAASTVSEVPSPMRRRSQRASKHPPAIKWIANPRSKEAWANRQADPRLQSMMAQRRTLPAWEMRQEVIDIVNNNQVTIISGETGSGKSTQSAQFILDDLYSRGFGEVTKIICTQPRRISALGLADRVSEERGSNVGQEVGYIIRGESKATSSTKITFVTTGVLLRRLQTSGGSSDDVVASLANVSHVIIDEVHERSLDTDFILVLLRDVLRKRKDLKLILMSATLDAGVFEDYFRHDGKVGRVEISGRTFPVEDYYLDDVVRMTGFNAGRGGRKDEMDEEDIAELDSDVASAIQSIGMRINYDLIRETVKEIDAELSHQKQEGGILIFLPGVLEINKTLDHLRSIPKLHVLPLHASLQSIEQRRVFLHAPPGKRKVIVATNVAETSITIDDIVAVIDTGRVKETSYDPQNNMRKLEEVWASRAACNQRRGRAGRVKAGKCYKLYTRNAEISKMAERPEPEIRRVPLEQLCLSVRAMGIKEVSQFLASALTPPESLAVDGAMDLLGRMGALDGDDLTALGRHLSMIPADLRCGKLMVFGATFGCLDACVIIAAVLTVKNPFVSPQEKRDEAKAARSRFANGHGDLIGDLRAFEQWEEMVNNRRYDNDVQALLNCIQSNHRL